MRGAHKPRVVEGTNISGEPAIIDLKMCDQNTTIVVVKNFVFFKDGIGKGMALLAPKAHLNWLKYLGNIGLCTT